MEGSQFISSLSRILDSGDIHILKVLSDYLDDSIPGKAFIDSLITKTLPQWDFLVDPYPAKVRKVFSETSSQSLLPNDRAAIRNAALSLRFSYQEIKMLVEMALDFIAWEEHPSPNGLKGIFSPAKMPGMQSGPNGRTSKVKQKHMKDLQVRVLREE